jgi:ribosomal protein L17
MKEKKKSYKKAMAEKMQKEMAKAEEIKASETPVQATTQEVVEQAVDNGAKASTEIPNSAPAAQPSVKEKYAAAFGFDGFELINK